MKKRDYVERQMKLSLAQKWLNIVAEKAKEGDPVSQEIMSEIIFDQENILLKYYDVHDDDHFREKLDPNQIEFPFDEKAIEKMNQNKNHEEHI